MEIEIYKDIKFTDVNGKEYDYTGLYQVSNLGNVKSFLNKKEKILKSNLEKGYLKISLSKNNKVKKFLVHRLVGLMFINNFENKLQINHIDGNKSNNNVNNLEWNTSSENIIHSYKKLNRKASNIGRLDIANKNSIKVDQYDLNNNYIKTWNSLNEIRRELNICNGSVSKVCSGKKLKTAGGYIWKYNNQ